jgi:hypothetical protein
MKIKLLGKLLMLGLTVFSGQCLAQSYHRLAARDFTGSAPGGDNFLAYTNCNVNYSYQVKKFNGRYLVDFNVQLLLNNHLSWIKFNEISNRELLLQILKHEQGHYNIAYLMKCELYNTLSRHRYSANYQEEIVVIFKQVESKYHRMNESYENQTQHMSNQQKQEEWDAWFSRQLDNVSMVNDNA